MNVDKNSIITLDSSPEEVLGIIEKNRCSRGGGCCLNGAIILESELPRIQQYAEEKLGIGKKDFSENYAVWEEILGVPTLHTKLIDGKCSFFAEVENPDYNGGKFKKIIGEFIKFFNAECTSGIRVGKIGNCDIHSVKPLNCRTYSCKNRVSTPWFLSNYVAKGNPEAEEKFREWYKRRNKYFI